MDVREFVERACRNVCRNCREREWKNIVGQTVVALPPVLHQGVWKHPYTINGKLYAPNAICRGNNIRIEFLSEMAELWDESRDQREPCACGHPYERHFDSYEEMEPVGCKYCGCARFTAKVM